MKCYMNIISAVFCTTVDWYNTELIDIHLHAVILTFNQLNILPREDHSYFFERHLHLLTCQNIISSILEGASDESLAPLIEQLR